jgi:hypothetical protein
MALKRRMTTMIPSQFTAKVPLINLRLIRRDLVFPRESYREISQYNISTPIQATDMIRSNR